MIYYKDLSSIMFLKNLDSVYCNAKQIGHNNLTMSFGVIKGFFESFSIQSNI